MQDVSLPLLSGAVVLQGAGDTNVGGAQFHVDVPKRSLGAMKTDDPLHRMPMALPLHAAAAGCTLDPSFPDKMARHASAQPLCAGFLNATAAPYSAAGDGSTDDTNALQAALDDAYAYRMAVLLEPGRVYVITRQLRAVQAGKPTSMREYGYQLVGGRGGPPPVLKVADGADLSGFPSIGTSARNGQQLTARPAVLFALNMSNTSGHPANNAPMLYSGMLRNIDIDLGNNPAVSGVSMSRAQLCSIEDVRV
jgi:hypothetical protein